MYTNMSSIVYNGPPIYWMWSEIKILFLESKSLADENEMIVTYLQEYTLIIY